MWPRFFDIVFGLVLLWIAYAELRSGEVHGRGGVLAARRSSNLVIFWMSVVITLIVGVSSIAQGCFKLF